MQQISSQPPPLHPAVLPEEFYVILTSRVYCAAVSKAQLGQTAVNKIIVVEYAPQVDMHQPLKRYNAVCERVA
jgi:hypothetical protein